MKTLTNMPIEKAKNIGPTIAKRLNGIGIHTLLDLAEVTPVKAYQLLSAEYQDKRLPICYYLYSLQGALMDMHWDDIPKELKSEMKKLVEIIELQ